MEQGVSLTKKVLRNTIYNLLGYIWGIAIGIFLTPFIIKHVGIERFGIWALAQALTGCFGLLDLGVGKSFIKYISEHYTRKEMRELNQLINTGFSYYFIFAVALSLFVALGISYVLRFFNISEQLYEEGKFVFLLYFVMHFFGGAFYIFEASILGLQRMDLSNKIFIPLIALKAMLIVALLNMGMGLHGLVYADMAVLLGGFILNMHFAKRILPELVFSPFRFFNAKTLKKLFSFGVKLQISKLSQLVSFQVDKVLIGHFLQVGLVSMYELGSRISGFVKSPMLLVSAVVPAASEIDARGEREKLYEFYLRGTKYLAIVGLPLTIFVASNSKLIMNVWMGRGYELAALCIAILSPGYFAAMISGMAASVAVGIGRAGLEMKYGVFVSIVNFLLSLILVIKIGFLGASIGTTFSLVVGCIFFLALFHKFVNKPFSDFVKLLVRPTFASLLALFVTDFVSKLFVPGPPAGRILGLTFILGKLAIFYLIFLISAAGLRCFDEADRRLARDVLRGGFGKRAGYV